MEVLNIEMIEEKPELVIMLQSIDWSSEHWNPASHTVSRYLFTPKYPQLRVKQVKQESVRLDDDFFSKEALKDLYKGREIIQDGSLYSLQSERHEYEGQHKITYITVIKKEDKSKIESLPITKDQMIKLNQSFKAYHTEDRDKVSEMLKAKHAMAQTLHLREEQIDHIRGYLTRAEDDLFKLKNKYSNLKGFTFIIAALGILSHFAF